MRRTPIRTITLLVALLLIASSLFATSPAEAQGEPVRDFAMESGFLNALNQQRGAQGLSPLTLTQSMTDAAAQWTYSMAAGNFLAHAGDIVTGTPPGWSKVGENVGRGQSVSSLTSAFMSSEGHRHNVLDPVFTHVGIGVYVDSAGKVYTTHRFAALGQPAPTAEPTAFPTPIPQPTAIPTAIPQPTAIPTPIPQPTAIPTPIPQPTAIPTPITQPTTIPTPIPEPTAIPTPIPEPTAIPTPIPQPAAEPTTAPAAILVEAPADQPSVPSTAAPEQLAFADASALADAAEAKAELKQAKAYRGARTVGEH